MSEKSFSVTQRDKFFGGTLRMKKINFLNTKFAALALGLSLAGQNAFAGGPGLIAKLVKEAGSTLVSALAHNSDSAIRATEEATAKELAQSLSSAFEKLGIKTDSAESFESSLKALENTSNGKALADAIRSANDFDATTVMSLARKANSVLAEQNGTTFDNVLRQADALAQKAPKADSPLDSISKEAISALGGMSDVNSARKEIADSLADGSPLEEKALGLTNVQEIQKLLALVRAVSSKRNAKAANITAEQRAAYAAIFENNKSTFGNLELASALNFRQLSADQQAVLIKHLEDAKTSGKNIFETFREAAQGNPEAMKIIDEMLAAKCFV